MVLKCVDGLRRSPVGHKSKEKRKGKGWERKREGEKGGKRRMGKRYREV